MLNRIDHLFQGVELAYIVSIESAEDEDMDSSEDLARLLKILNQLSIMFYKSAKLREQNNQRKALMEHDNDSDTAVAKDTLSEVTTSKDEEESTTISIERDNNQDEEDISLSKRIEVSTISQNDALLLSCDPQRKIINHFNNKALSADKIQTKPLESST